MYTSYHQAKFEMRAKEAEFTRELNRARTTKSKPFYLVDKLIQIIRKSATQNLTTIRRTASTPSYSGS